MSLLSGIKAWLARKWNENRKRFIIVTTIIVVVFLASQVAIVEYTCTAGFCNLCHSMKEVKSYDTWIISTHGPEKNHAFHNCMPCHSAPGFAGFIKAKIGGMLSLYHEVAQDFHRPLVAHKPVYCGRPQCHPRPDEIADDHLTVAVNHSDHLGYMKEKFECMPCHSRVVHGDDPEGRNQPKMTICFECHDDETAPREDCTMCHFIQADMMNGVAGLEVEETPSFHMEEGIACVDCHDPDNEYKPTAESCMNCHDEDYGEVLTEWQEAIDEYLIPMKNNLEDIIAKVEYKKSTGTEVSGKILELHDVAYENYMYVLRDGSKGVHNIDHATELITIAKEKAQAAFDETKSW